MQRSLCAVHISNVPTEAELICAQGLALAPGCPQPHSSRAMIHHRPQCVRFTTRGPGNPE